LKFDLDPDATTPWSAGHPVTDIPLNPRWTWRFTVYGGLFDTDSIKTSLRTHFDTDDDQRRASGQTALFAFIVDHAGFLVENSASLSSSAWALGRLRRSGGIPQDWLDGFAAEERSFASNAALLCRRLHRCLASLDRFGRLGAA
jgi:hypothetical protein